MSQSLINEARLDIEQKLGIKDKIYVCEIPIDLPQNENAFGHRMLWAMDQRIKAIATMVLISLCDVIRKHGLPSSDTIVGEDVDLFFDGFKGGVDLKSKKTILKHLNILEELKLILIKRNGSKILSITINHNGQCSHRCIEREREKDEDWNPYLKNPERAKKIYEFLKNNQITINEAFILLLMLCNQEFHNSDGAFAFDIWYIDNWMQSCTIFLESAPEGEFSGSDRKKVLKQLHVKKLIEMHKSNSYKPLCKFLF